MDTVTRTSCPHCARPHTASDARGLDWSSTHSPDGVRFVCGPCTRARLTEIECGPWEAARSA